MKTSEKKWSEIRKGVFAKHLARDSQLGLQLDIIRLQKDAAFPRHSHPEFEWVYILDGEMSEKRGSFQKGDFLVNEKGSSHKVRVGSTGCTILCVWSGVVKTENERSY